MRLDQLGIIVTLDWDNCSYQELIRRVDLIKNPRITLILFRNSPRRKGYHLRIYHDRPILIAKTRRKYFDDPKRLLHDILNPDHIHDILWTRKTINGKKYIAGKWRIIRLDR